MRGQRRRLATVLLFVSIFPLGVDVSVYIHDKDVQTPAFGSSPDGIRPDDHIHK